MLNISWKYSKMGNNAGGHNMKQRRSSNNDPIFTSSRFKHWYDIGSILYLIKLSVSHETLFMNTYLKTNRNKIDKHTNHNITFGENDAERKEACRRNQGNLSARWNIY